MLNLVSFNDVWCDSCLRGHFEYLIRESGVNVSVLTLILWPSWTTPHKQFVVVLLVVVMCEYMAATGLSCLGNGWISSLM